MNQDYRGNMPGTDPQLYSGVSLSAHDKRYLGRVLNKDASRDEVAQELSFSLRRLRLPTRDKIPMPEPVKAKAVSENR